MSEPTTLSIWYNNSTLGDPYIWISFALIGFISYYLLREKFPRKMEGFRGFLKVFIPALFFTLVIVQGMKIGFNVERPCTVCLIDEQVFDRLFRLPFNCNPYCPIDPSFPSGHAAAIFVFFTSAFLRIRKHQFYPLFAAPVIIAYARYAINVHTMIDIIVGSSLGIVITILAWGWLKNRPKKGSFWDRIGI